MLSETAPEWYSQLAVKCSVQSIKSKLMSCSKCQSNQPTPSEAPADARGAPT